MHRCTRRPFFWGALLVAALILAPSVGFAQDIQLEDVVHAKIETPKAFYVLRASRLKYKAMKPKESFLPELYKTVQKDPF